MLKILISTVLILVMFSCSSTKKVSKQSTVSNESQNTSESDSTAFASKDELTEEERNLLQTILDAIEDVPFDFDSYNIPSQGLDILKKNVDLLNKMLATRKKYITITIEGHTDDRGSENYNLALGDRRAMTVFSYLIAVGFQQKSLEIISFGEEKPKVNSQSEEAWAANRRVRLVVK